MFDWDGLIELIWKGLAGGGISYVARRIFEQDRNQLDSLQGSPPESTDIDREELLAHYIEELTEEIGDLQELTIDEGVKIIRSRAGVFATRLYLKVQRLSSEGEKPKGV